MYLEIFGAIQTLLLGNLPITLLDFHTSHNILNKVSFSLPEGHGLLMGSHIRSVT
jgi:hypothetical protein